MNIKLLLKQYRKKVIIAFATIVLAILAYFIFKTPEVYTDDAYLNSNISVVRPRVSGYITHVLIKDNQKVKKGDVLARIDDRDYKLQLKEVQEKLEAITLQIKSLEKKLVVQVLNTQKALFALNAAETTFMKVDKDFKRAQVLVKENAISKQSYDDSFAAQNSAKNKYDSAKMDLEISKVQESVIKLELEQVKTQLHQLEANLGLAKINLENTKIIAHTNGAINRKALQVGQLASPGSSLAYLVQEGIWLEANFKENDVGKMKEGQEAIVYVDAISGKKFKAKIDSISPGTGAKFSILPPENATGNFTKIVQRVPVKIVFDEKQDLTRLRPGLSCEVTVKLR